MTGATDGATAAPPKKRSFFKKAAWQTKPKVEGDQDIFSHSNEFKDIVAEENRRKQDQKRKQEDEKKRKAEQDQDRKRRKISLEAQDLKLLGSRSGSSDRSTKRDSKARSRTPLSPLPASPLGQRYDSLTKSSSSTNSFHEKPSHIIDLGESESDPDDSLYRLPKPTVASLPSRPVPADDLEEVEDPTLAALRARARARAKNKEASTPAEEGVSPKDTQPDPIVQLFITSDIPDTKGLMVKIRTSSTLEKPRKSWCSMQKFSPEMTQQVFFTWKDQKLFDFTTIKRLGVNIDSNGIVTVEGDSEIYTDDNLPKIHLAAWTEELYKQYKKEQAEVAEAMKKAAEPVVEVEEPIPEPEPEVKKTRLILKAKGKADFKITVNATTTFEHLTAAYKTKNEISKSQPITLMFDGERLRPMDTIGDTDFDDLDAIEVHFK